uniref:ArsR/SmtB family transcription factor n=1 Tax=Bacillaceae bacterium JMAK1 TaxID=1028381 RepID=UPI0003ABF362|nr:metalloregulator ArsR/SmtB family transcription factor [Bacillaceae bacterium JMAK1]AGQ45460.1 bacterial transcriptional regulator family ArsR [Bacillaceae bacterium JMAK1]
MDQEVCCAPKPDLKERSLLDMENAEGLSDTFKILSNGTRLRILHALIRKPNISVGEIAKQVDMNTQAVSNQLQRLVDKGIVSSFRQGNFIHYQIVDPCVIGLLDRGWCLTEELR